MSRRSRHGRHARAEKYWTLPADEHRMRTAEGHPFGCVFKWDRKLGASVCIKHTPRVLDEIDENSPLA